MLPELSIERVFRRELESLPLPDESLWVPRPESALLSPLLPLALAGAALFLLLVAAVTVRDATGAATQPPRSSGCAAPAFEASGRCLSHVPNLVRNAAFGYNLTIPGEWREVRLSAGTEPFVGGQPSGAPALSASFLLDRLVFTARSPEAWVAPSGVIAPAWDLDVQVWDRQGRTALEWSRAFPCDDPAVTLGDTNCVRTTETIRGLSVPVTTVYSFRWHITSYYFTHGNQMVVLRYMFSETIAPPPGVTEETLQGIVRSIGLA